ncbi:glutamine synthetase [Teratosphaeria destructans]|uniref:Glutamine synthetase n=1 Tax=Teratosphaeria destructans TaxID=418781 RepID=A0A9W7T2E2_9PEZI|nr:glutamine synthetase [Teratosphaeria destructans]
MDLTPLSLRSIVTKPVLQQWRVERSWAERIEAKAFTSMDDSKLAGHGQDSTFGGGISQLRSGGTDQGNDRGGVDDAAFCLLVLAKREDGVLAAEPYAFHIDVVGQIPDLLRSIDGVCKQVSAYPIVLVLLARVPASSACMIPALLNMTSNPPQASSLATAASTSASLETSTLTVSTLPGACGASSLALVMAFASAGSEISHIKTEAPSRRNSTVVSRPMPLEYMLVD